jgi:hypothetical protein
MIYNIQNQKQGTLQPPKLQKVMYKKLSSLKH